MVRTPPFQGENPGSNPSGAAKNQKHPFGCFLFLLESPGLNRDAPERSAWRIRGYTIRKIIKTGSVMTSFYRFLLLRIEEASENPSGAAKIDKTAFLRFFVCFPILSRVRKLGGKNSNRFAHLRTFVIEWILLFCLLSCLFNKNFITIQKGFIYW